MPHFDRRLARLGLLLLFVCAPIPAHAWGPSGHRIVAELAQQRLSPSAQREVARVLGGRQKRLADVANWADELRNEPAQRDLWRASSKLHFVNFGAGSCNYQPARDCARGQCVVAAIDNYARILGDRSRSRAERAQALRFVVHFVADVHQPLHASPRADKGGNTYQVRFDGKGTNLHAVWDSRLLSTRKLGWSAYAGKLAPKRHASASGDARLWAQESCRSVRDDAIYPRGHRIDAAYVKRMRPLAERQLQRAAVRLAALLDRTLGQ